MFLDRSEFLRPRSNDSTAPTARLVSLIGTTWKESRVSSDSGSVV